MFFFFFFSKSGLDFCVFTNIAQEPPQISIATDLNARMQDVVTLAKMVTKQSSHYCDYNSEQNYSLFIISN